MLKMRRRQAYPWACISLQLSNTSSFLYFMHKLNELYAPLLMETLDCKQIRRLCSLIARSFTASDNSNRITRKIIISASLMYTTGILLLPNFSMHNNNPFHFMYSYFHQLGMIRCKMRNMMPWDADAYN